MELPAPLREATNGDAAVGKSGGFSGERHKRGVRRLAIDAYGTWILEFRRDVRWCRGRRRAHGRRAQT